MNPSSRRVRNLGIVFGVAVVGVLVHLAYLMVGQHEVWEMRSYGNRWAFRDVPTKRGGIRDRKGVVLVKDVPATSLSLYYRAFRRQHPCGAAVHGANTALLLVGSSNEYRYGWEAIESAFQHCLQLPLSVLRTRVVDDATVPDEDVGKRIGDLRFYLCSMIAGLTDGAPFWRRYMEVRGGCSGRRMKAALV